MEFEGISLAGLKQIKVRKGRIDEEEKEEEEPLSPIARMFHKPESNVYIVVLVGFKSPIHPHTFKANLAQTLLKHPRFSSVQVSPFYIGACMAFNAYNGFFF